MQGVGSPQTDEEIGYPHELIMEAINQSSIVIKNNYRHRIKLLATIINKIIEKKEQKIDPKPTSDSIMLLLESLAGNGNLIQASKKFRTDLVEMLSNYESKQSQIVDDEIINFLRDGIFLQIICFELNKFQLIDNRIIEKIKALCINNSELLAILSALEILNGKIRDFIPYSVIYEFSKLTDKDFEIQAIYLTYELSIRYPKFKRELLYTHYLLVKKKVVDFRSIFGQENLSDLLLEDIFKNALILYYCGYAQSLRLPKLEKINYGAKVLELPSIESATKEAFDEVASINVSWLNFKVKLWVLAAVELILIIMHWFYEIYLPLEYSPFGLTIKIPAIPAFLVIALIIGFTILVYLFRLEREFTKKLRRGENAKQL